MPRLALFASLLFAGPALADIPNPNYQPGPGEEPKPRCGAGVALTAGLIAVGLLAARMARRGAV